MNGFMKGNKRNKPCVCGSGKKWKKCCESAKKWNAERDEFNARMQEAIEERAQEREAAEEERAAGAAEKRRHPMRAATFAAIAAACVLGGQ